MSGAADTLTYPSPPALLTFLAPAERCNQRCPECLLEAMGEPVTEFGLSPYDYARFLQQFLDAGVPVLSVAFQGYEVTLPRSWPYVEAVFRRAQEHGVRRGFVTNGMLLHKWADPLREYLPNVTVSLDGSSPEVNDKIRGLQGALNAALGSVRRTLRQVPELTDQLMVASTVYGETNFRSLLDMPALLLELGIRRWAVGWAMKKDGSVGRPVHSSRQVGEWLLQLRAAADASGITFHTADDFGILDEADREVLNARSVYNLSFMYRMDPLGYVRSGESLLDSWSVTEAQRWRPSIDNAVETVGYWNAANPYLEPGSGALSRDHRPHSLGSTVSS